MMRVHAAPLSQTLVWTLLVLMLLALRVPSLAQPSGGDQGLYMYAGQRVLNGGVPYRDMWDQKPPGIMFAYAALWRLWPHESMVPAADLAAAALVAWLLIVLGRHTAGVGVGYGAACIFLLFGDPALTRLSGLYIRAQCETFIALAVTAALVFVIMARHRWHFVLAGVWLGVAFWLKDNAIVYLLPVVVATWQTAPATERGKTLVTNLIALALGLSLVIVLGLLYFAVHDALPDLRLATIDYNLLYSSETYGSPFGVLGYLVRFPIERARIEMLWFLGGVGAVLLIINGRFRGPSLVVLSWLVAAGLSIAANGARNLPQYFVQAGPALALAAAAGFAGLQRRPAIIRYAVAAIIVVGLWRVGSEAPMVAGLRLGGLPQLAENLRFDVAALTGRIDRTTYLARFASRKYDAHEVAQLASYADQTTTPADRMLVFGFLGGSVGAKAQRASASRFFWSRPVIIEFAAGHAGYGSAGLLRDLEAHPPRLVALQKHDWHSTVDAALDSLDFFMSNPPLRSWLEAGYVLDRDTPVFAVWRRRS